MMADTKRRRNGRDRAPTFAILPWIAFVGVLYVAGDFATAPAQRPPEIPKHMAATSRELPTYAGKRYVLTVESRRPERDPARTEDLEQLRTRAERLVKALPLTPAPDEASADLRIAYLYEPDLRYGMFHSQNAPYQYLLAREARSGTLLFCGFEREGAFSSASARLFVELRRALLGKGAVSLTDIAACAEGAMRPPSSP